MYFKIGAYAIPFSVALYEGTWQQNRNNENVAKHCCVLQRMRRKKLRQ
jgi:hypothetical protein